MTLRCTSRVFDRLQRSTHSTQKVFQLEAFKKKKKNFLCNLLPLLDFKPQVWFSSRELLYQAVDAGYD